MSIFRLFKSEKNGQFVSSNRDPFSLCAFQHIQHGTASTWTISHNNASNVLNIQVFVDNKLIIPNTIKIVNENTIELSFSQDVAGFVNFLIMSDEESCITYMNPSATPTPTPSLTPSVTATPTVTPSVSITPTITNTPNVTVTPTPTPSVTPSVTGTPLISATVTPSVTPTVTPTPSTSISVTPTPTPTISVTPSVTITPSPTISVTPSVTASVTPTVTPTISVTPSSSPVLSATPTPTPTVTPTISVTASVTPTVTPTPSVTPSTGSSNLGFNPLNGHTAFGGDNTDIINDSGSNLSQVAESQTVHDSGYWYVELEIIDDSNCGAGFIVSGNGTFSWLGNNGVNGVGVYEDGELYTLGTLNSTNDLMQVGDTFRLWMRDNRVWLGQETVAFGTTIIGGGDPASDTLPTFTLPAASTIAVGATCFANTGRLKLKTTTAEFLYSALGATAWDGIAPTPSVTPTPTVTPSPSPSPTLNQGFDPLNGHTTVGGDNAIIENLTTNDLSQTAYSKTSHASGYRYAEIVLLNDGVPTGGVGMGVILNGASSNWVGNNSTDSVAVWNIGGNVYQNGGIIITGNSMIANDTVRIWTRGNRVWIGQETVAFGSVIIGGGDPLANTTPTFTLPAGQLHIGVTCFEIDGRVQLKTDPIEFSYSTLGALGWDEPDPNNLNLTNSLGDPNNADLNLSNDV